MKYSTVSRALSLSGFCVCALAFGACDSVRDDAREAEIVEGDGQAIRMKQAPSSGKKKGRRPKHPGEPCKSAAACDDHDPCTEDVCNAGECEHVALTCGTPCAIGGKSCDDDAGVCDGNGACVAPGRPLWDRTYDLASARDVAVGPDGSIYVAGIFSGVVDIGTGPLTPDFASGLFLARYAADGTILWAEALGTTASDVFVTGVAVDPSGNVAITGVFDGTLDLGGSPFTSVGSSDAFLAKFDPSGAHVWSRRIGGPGFQSGMSVATDAAGDLAITGYFDGSIDFGAGPVAAVPGNTDVFVAKYDASGALLWAKRFGDADQQVGWDVAMDPAGDVAITGFMAGTIDFGGGPLATPGVGASFAAEFDPAGALIWGSVFGTTGAAAGRGVAFDPSGAVVLTGEFHGTLDFGAGMLSSQGEQDLYVAKMNTSGQAIWSERFGDPSAFVESRDVVVDALGNIVTTGDLVGTVDFGGGPLSSGVDQQTYVLKLDPAGNHLWGRLFGGDGFGRPFGIAAGTCEVIVVGEFAGTLDFGSGPRASANGAAYIAALGP